MSHIFKLLIIPFLFQCSPKKTEQFKPGIYSTHKVKWTTRNSYRKRYGKKFFRTYLIAINLKKDSLFSLEFCDNTIHFTGSWSRISENEILLSNIFNHKSKKIHESKVLPYTEDGYLLYPSIAEYDDIPGKDTFYTFLKINGNEMSPSAVK